HVVPLLKKDTTHLVKNANHFSESVALLSKCQSDFFDSLPSPINFSKALRGKKEDLARLNTHEAAAFFDYLIYKKWHQRIHFDEIDLNKNVIFNKENFQLLFYQKYYYLINRNELAVIDPKKKLVKLNEKFSLNGKKRSEEHTSELQSRFELVCRLLLEKKKKKNKTSRGLCMKKQVYNKNIRLITKKYSS